MLTTFFESSSLQTKGMLARLAPSLSSAALEDAIGPMIETMIGTIEDDDASIEIRIEAANRVVALSPSRVKTIDALFDMIGPQSPTSLSLGLMNATGKSSVPGVGPRLIEVAQSGTPSIRDAVPIGPTTYSHQSARANCVSRIFPHNNARLCKTIPPSMFVVVSAN